MNKLITLTAIILILPLANAFGASSQYFDENPLFLEPGESTTISLYLQNMVGDKDITLNSEIKAGKEIASMSQTQFSVPFGQKNIEAPIKITIPENARDGDKFLVTVSFTSNEQSNDEMLQLKSTTTSTFPVIIKEVRTSPLLDFSATTIIFYLILLIIVVAMTITLIILFKAIKRKDKPF